MVPQRILVVDDEPGIRQAIEMLLSFDGHTIVTAASGKKALEKFKPDQFDVVFTDFSMAGMKGDELALAIKKISPSTPILLLTAFPPASKPAGIDLVLTKPFFRESMREALKTLLGPQK